MRDLPEPIEIAPRLWASKGLPVRPGEHWERWLGELAFRPLRAALVLTATANTPGLVINTELRDKRVFTYIPTPTANDGESIDENALRQVIDYQIEMGVDGICVLGSTGVLHAAEEHDSWLEMLGINE